MMANVDWWLITEATIDTLLMTGFSLLFTVLIGLPVGVLLFLTSPGQVMQHRGLYQTTAFIVNVLRSVPFLILLIVMIPMSRLLVGTALGVQGSIPPLVASAAPFFCPPG
jgi:D-methionine transport system permease protein